MTHHRRPSGILKDRLDRRRRRAKKLKHVGEPCPWCEEPVQDTRDMALGLWSDAPYHRRCYSLMFGDVLASRGKRLADRLERA